MSDLGADDAPAPDIESGLTVEAGAADLRGVARVLASQRAAILAGWLVVASAQPFHVGRPDSAVSDHIPLLFDALVGRIAASGPPGTTVPGPLEDDPVTQAAAAHAAARAEQGLSPTDISVEFRLLRQEVTRCLARSISDALPAGEVVIASGYVNDGIDAAISVALAALTQRIETLREEFLATTLHDLRQPMTVVSVALHLLDRRLAEPAEVPEDVHQADLGELVADALAGAWEVGAALEALGDASQVAMGAIRPSLEPTSLRELVVEAVAALDHSQRARVRILGEADVTVGCDRRLVRRLLLNLLSNALKYSPDGESIEVGLAIEQGMATLRVADHGIGLSADELDHVFDRYARSERARATGVPGLGLGLYAARGIARAHGGDVTLLSPGAGAGTVAVLRLPLEPTSSAEPSAPG